MKRKRTKAILVTSSDTHNRLIIESNPIFSGWVKDYVKDFNNPDGYAAQVGKLMQGSWNDKK